MSVRAEFLRIGIRMLLKRRGGNLDVEQWRRNMRAMERFVPRPPARSATVKLEAGRVTLHRVTTPASRPERNVLYLHGGAYVSGAPVYYRHFLWRIADALQARIWALEYRLAPEHPFPAALEDAVEGHHWLADHTPDIGQLFVAGDSAGGGLALGLLLRLRDDGKPLPAAAERRGSARLGETLSRRNRSAHAPRFAALWRSRRIAAGAYSGGQR